MKFPRGALYANRKVGVLAVFVETPNQGAKKVGPVVGEGCVGTPVLAGSGVRWLLFMVVMIV